MNYNPNLRRILFIFPPSTSLPSWEPMVTSPMGILYLAAAARDRGYEVACLDTVLEAPYQETPVSENVSRYGLTLEQIMRRVRSYAPDVVGLSCIFSNQWPAVRELAKAIKAETPETIVISGGAHPTFLSERCMRDAPFDFILRGESEDSLLELLDRLKAERPYQDVDGLVYRDGDRIVINEKVSFIEDLDRLPIPAHDLLDTEKYFKLALPMGYSFMSPRGVPVVTSRGCPCSCTFCSSTNLWGKRYRVRSTDNVMAELDWLVSRFRIEEIKFQDDNLTVSKKRARELFQKMIDRPYHLHWSTPNGIAVWTLDDELLGLMKRSGCYEFTMAVESGNQEVLTNLIRKPLKLDKVREVNELAKKYDLSRTAYFIIGFPGETRAQIMDTVRFARSLKLHVFALFIFNPLPGSEMFQECLKRGYITEESFFEVGNQYFTSVIDSDEWTAAELERLIRWEWFRCYFAFFHSPWIVGRRYLKYFQHRPSFLKYFFLRTLRMLKLAGPKTPASAPKPGG